MRLALWGHPSTHQHRVGGTLLGDRQICDGWGRLVLHLEGEPNHRISLTECSYQLLLRSVKLTAQQSNTGVIIPNTPLCSSTHQASDVFHLRQTLTHVVLANYSQPSTHQGCVGGTVLGAQICDSGGAGLVLHLEKEPNHFSLNECSVTRCCR